MICAFSKAVLTPIAFACLTAPNPGRQKTLQPRGGGWLLQNQRQTPTWPLWSWSWSVRNLPHQEIEQGLQVLLCITCCAKSCAIFLAFLIHVLWKHFWNFLDIFGYFGPFWATLCGWKPFTDSAIINSKLNAMNNWALMSIIWYYMILYVFNIF